MSSIVNAFEFQSQEIRFIGDKPVANDVAKVLGYADPSATVSKKVFPENKGVAKMETPARGFIIPKRGQDERTRSTN